MPIPVFTYGSLMFAPVWERVVRGRYAAASATLADHARRAVRHDTYPGMIAMPGESVQGVVYLDVSDEDVAALDAFEGGDYRRIPVTVMLEDGEAVQAHTYLYLPLEKLSDSPWRTESFQMERFIGTYCRARLGPEQTESV